MRKMKIQLIKNVVKSLFISLFNFTCSNKVRSILETSCKAKNTSQTFTNHKVRRIMPVYHRPNRGYNDQESVKNVDQGC